MPTLEVLERLDALPLLMVWGRQDAFCQPSAEAWAEACQRVRPGAQQVMIADAAHWCQYERPDVVNQAVLRFVAGLEEGPRPIQKGGSGAGR
jgi:pimeloyl-ACP methyl ester carboxylesterase